MRIIKFSLVLALAFALTACGVFKSRPNYDTLPVGQLYTSAHQSLENGDYSAAEIAYKRLIARFPYGEYNQQSQLDLAYTQYKNNEPDDAYSTINRFLKTYPAQKHVDYAYYLRGLINFDRSGPSLQRYLQKDESRIDQGYRLQSFDDFSELSRRFPGSAYAIDARQRMIYLRNGLAQFEINVAEYYFRVKAYVASADRAKYVIEHYQQAPETADALAILTRSYLELGRTKLAAQTRDVLKLNYPDHPYLTDPNWPHYPPIWKRMIPFYGHH